MKQLTDQVVNITKVRTSIISFAFTKLWTTLWQETLEIIPLETGLEHYIIGGSWAAEQIVAAQATVCRGDDEVFPFCLSANDIDVFHGDFIDAADGKCTKCFEMRTMLTVLSSWNRS